METKISTPTQHEFDIDKIESLDDVKLILKSLYLIIYDNHEDFDTFKHLLKE